MPEFLVLLWMLNMPDAQGQVIEAMLKGRGLSTKDKNLAKRLYVSPADMRRSANSELRPSNFQELEKEIGRTSDPTIKALLVQEHNKLKELAEQFLMRQAMPNPQLEAIGGHMAAPQPMPAPQMALHGVRG